MFIKNDQTLIAPPSPVKYHDYCDLLHDYKPTWSELPVTESSKVSQLNKSLL